ncbi:hypothetical protein [Iodidimonas gelatinilytica]|nr:hypothetical protein [Iodidimonas gelatinilytica]
MPIQYSGTFYGQNIERLPKINRALESFAGRKAKLAEAACGLGL